jgi:hypothetical protein
MHTFLARSTSVSAWIEWLVILTYFLVLATFIVSAVRNRGRVQPLFGQMFALGLIPSFICAVVALMRAERIRTSASGAIHEPRIILEVMNPLALGIATTILLTLIHVIQWVRRSPKPSPPGEFNA